ncbi:MAG: type II secretion system F family protein [Firmicutes bacterium]|nr:type II secretion system F family protein [Bacillota bacterium]
MKYKTRKNMESKREELLYHLPLFVNQLLLLLNSGMVLQEAMTKIFQEYENMDNEKENLFTVSYVSYLKKARNTNMSIVKAFDIFAVESHVKEIARISKILIDGDKRGIDFSETLKNEMDCLWQQRKRIALEKIRTMETKMSFPLALLLMALILMMAAPAMMQMQIN